MADDDHAIDPAAPDEGEHNRARMRLPKRVLLIGIPVAFVLSLLTSFAGLDGRAGAFAFLLLLALVLGATGLLVTVQLILDDRKGSPTSLRRALVGFGLFAMTFVCMVATGGLVESAA